MARLRTLRSGSGFTLIELLVVVLIIGILIAVSAPSFLGQTSKAHDSVAKQNLAVGYRSAATTRVDNDGHYPVFGTDPALRLAVLTAQLQADQPQLTFFPVSDYRAVAGMPANFIGVDSQGSSDSEYVSYTQSGSGDVWCLEAGDAYAAGPVGAGPYFADLSAAGSCPSATSTSSSGPGSGYGLAVARSGAGGGTVTADSGAIDCGSICFDTYSSDAAVTLHATPDSASEFLGWGGDCSGSTADCTVTMDTLHSAVAIFGVTGGGNGGGGQNPLGVRKAGSGSGAVTSTDAAIDCGSTCTTVYDASATTTLAALADPGSRFAGWGGDCSGSSTCTLEMAGPHEVLAYFVSTTPSSDVTLYASVHYGGQGYVYSSPNGISCLADCDQSYNPAAKTQVALLPLAQAGSHFYGWSGDCSGDGSCTVTMDRDHHVVANFAPNSWGGGGGGGFLHNGGTLTNGPGYTDGGGFDSYLTVMQDPTSLTGPNYFAGAGKGAVSMVTNNGLGGQGSGNPYDSWCFLGGSTWGYGCSLPKTFKDGIASHGYYSITLKVVPDKGSTFAGWTDLPPGTCSNSSTTCTLTNADLQNNWFAGVKLTADCPTSTIKGTCQDANSGSGGGSSVACGTTGDSPNNAAGAPANDDFANAQGLPSDLSGSISGTLNGATVEFGSPNESYTDNTYSTFDNNSIDSYSWYVGQTQTVWYCWKAPQSADGGLITIDTNGSPAPYDGIYPDEAPTVNFYSTNDWTQLKSDWLAGAYWNPTYTRITYPQYSWQTPLVGGQTYLISVSNGKMAGIADSGAFTLNWSAGADSDSDGVADTIDNCPTVANPGQANTYHGDSPDVGDACSGPPAPAHAYPLIVLSNGDGMYELDHQPLMASDSYDNGDGNTYPYFNFGSYGSIYTDSPYDSTFLDDLNNYSVSSIRVSTDGSHYTYATRGHVYVGLTQQSSPATATDISSVIGPGCAAAGYTDKNPVFIGPSTVAFIRLTADCSGTQELFAYDAAAGTSRVIWVNNLANTFIYGDYDPLTYSSAANKIAFSLSVSNNSTTDGNGSSGLAVYAVSAAGGTAAYVDGSPLTGPTILPRAGEPAYQPDGAKLVYNLDYGSLAGTSGTYATTSSSHGTYQGYYASHPQVQAHTGDVAWINNDSGRGGDLYVNGSLITTDLANFSGGHAFESFAWAPNGDPMLATVEDFCSRPYGSCHSNGSLSFINWQTGDHYTGITAVGAEPAGYGYSFSESPTIGWGETP